MWIVHYTLCIYHWTLSIKKRPLGTHRARRFVTHKHRTGPLFNLLILNELQYFITYMFFKPMNLCLKISFTMLLFYKQAVQNYSFYSYNSNFRQRISPHTAKPIPARRRGEWRLQFSNRSYSQSTITQQVTICAWQKNRRFCNFLAP